MADFECTCSVVKGERDIAYGEDCYCWYQKPNYDERFVRCKDCKHVGKRWSMRIGDSGFHGYMRREMDCSHCEPSGFCAWGERREDEE